MGKNKRKNFGIGSRLWWKAVLIAVALAVAGVAICYFLGGRELLLGVSQTMAPPGHTGPSAVTEGDLEMNEEEPVEGSALSVWNSADLSQPLPEPAVSAKTAVVLDIDTGRVLYEKNKDERIFPASTTKIMTALLAIEKGEMDKKVKVSPKAVGVEGSSIYLAAGEVVTLRDLVYGLMLRSGNDAAVAIAQEISGGTEEFVKEMNRRAAELGAENTHFVTPNGLHDDQHYTTAYDMAVIARQAMQNPVFREVAKAKSYQADRGEGKYNVFYNKNKVVYQYEGGTGVKIGYTKTAGRTLVASSERNGMRLICVVMNDPNWFNDSYGLMDYVYSNYEQVTAAEGMTPLKSFPLSGGEKEQVLVGTKQKVCVPVAKGSETNISLAYALEGKAKAPVSRWEQAGMLHVYVDGVYSHSEPLYYMEDVGKM